MLLFAASFHLLSKFLTEMRSLVKLLIERVQCFGLEVFLRVD